MKRITLEEIEKNGKFETYEALYRHILSEISSGRLSPVKASGINGKKPALYLRYWVTEEEKDYGCLKEELIFGLTPLISPDYYLKNLSLYEKDREWVRMLNRFLTERRELLNQTESINERSFEIWGQEKFLKRGQGMRILKNCGISPDFLNYYETTEPMPCYTHTREVPQNLLLLENKDTFYSMRRHLLEGKDTILGMKIGTLIYGAGKGILKSFQDFSICAEPYMQNRQNQIYYFGDLDYEGIGIYEKLEQLFGDQYSIRPFMPGYFRMLEKAEGVLLPITKEQQNRNLTGQFFACFPQSAVEQMKKILESEQYIPQEILNIRDFGGLERVNLPQSVTHS